MRRSIADDLASLGGYITKHQADLAYFDLCAERARRKLEAALALEEAWQAEEEGEDEA